LLQNLNQVVHLLPVLSPALVLTWMKMKDDVDDVLITPNDRELVFLVDRYHVFSPAERSHARQIHEHYPRVDTCQTLKLH
jgi:hypothetical protein